MAFFRTVSSDTPTNQLLPERNKLGKIKIPCCIKAFPYKFTNYI